MDVRGLRCVSRLPFLVISRNLRRRPYYEIAKPALDPEQQQTDYFERKAAELEIDTTYIDKLNSLWHDKTSISKDLRYKREDSLVQSKNFGLPEVAPLAPKLGFENIEALKTAPEAVQKIFSAEYGERRDMSAIWKKQITEMVQQTPLDNSSLESRIGRMTGFIRHWSLLVKERAEITPKKPKPLMRLIILLMDHRRKLLRLLREQNHESFQRVLKTLKISYEVPILPEDLPMSTRKGWVERQVALRAESIKEQKLRDLYERLKAEDSSTDAERDREQEALLEAKNRLLRKLEALEWGDGKELEVAGRFHGRTIDFQMENLMLRWYYWEPGQDMMSLGY